ncbi:hypothetical protein FB45DRAFT_1058324 [Roridomyces roridus]|uniref:Uncharacterized protein n=1 Tax=Roridomyces roridus TaxID=1738132 RepID=A0AAD7FKR0_9AGAR|nr:hypothetical protein FB45DRAFT_1058324 [Roridomyces roridus]
MIRIFCEEEEEHAKRRSTLHGSTRENQTRKRPAVKPLNIRKHKLNVLVDIPEEDEVPPPQASTMTPQSAIATRPLSGGPLYFILDDEVEWEASAAEARSPDDSPFGRFLHSREYYYGLLDEGEEQGEAASPAASDDKAEGSAESSSPHDAQPAAFVGLLRHVFYLALLRFDFTSSSVYDCAKSPQFGIMPPASKVAWFSFNEDLSSSWPPKITFTTDPVPRSSSPFSSDSMEGVITQRPQSTPRNSYSRAIPNRSSRSNTQQSVPTTPPNLWRQVPSKQEAASFTRCRQPPVGSGRVRAIPDSVDLGFRGPGCPESRPVRCVRETSRCLPPPVIHVERSVEERDFRLLWSAEKRKNPHLPLVVSSLNPLRASMPPSYPERLPSNSSKAQWNYKKPIQRQLPWRRDCDAASDRLSSRAIFLGKAGSHCRSCKDDTLLKRLLRFNYWIAFKDEMFEAALDLEDEADCWDILDEAGAEEDHNFPKGVSSHDRDDFEDEGGDRMDSDDAPVIDIVQRYPQLSGRLF